MNFDESDIDTILSLIDEMNEVYDQYIFEGKESQSIIQFELIMKKLSMERATVLLKASINEKAVRLMKMALPNPEEHFAFRKFVRFVISLKSPSVFDALETYYLSEKDPVPLAIVLEEFIKAGVD